ncbi:glucosamine-6-phosphate deaminase [Deltaproteobacteria bacterium Smac51]|nr:glucosamine-6-phosphate deaminase [Deltaproteobacteria bacterium Smac51]
MRLIITSRGVGRWAANYVMKKMKAVGATDERNFILGLPTGGTAVELYRHLVASYKKGDVSFKNVTTFNMDEYIGLPEDHPESYHTYMRENLFSQVDMDPAKINIPNGNAPDLAAECRDYDQRMADCGGVDLFLGGVGENGHIAFNEPYSSLMSSTRDKQLDVNTRLANSRFFGGDISQVPKSALTVGVKGLLDAREVLIMITGAKKALALCQCMEGAVSQAWPITALQLHPKAIIVADEEACGELKVKTYRYFKELQDEFSYIDEL